MKETVSSRVFIKSISYIFFLALVGCNYFPSRVHPTATPQRFPTSAFFINDWLNQECSLPCWHGIVPSQTHVGDALEILRSLPEINYVEDIKATTDSPAVVRFDVTGGSTRLITGGLFYDADSRIVESIRYFAGDTLTIQDVVTILGQPSHFSSSATSFDGKYLYETYILFSSSGVRLDWMSGALNQKQYSLDPNQHYLNVTLFNPNSANPISTDSDENIQPWLGFIALEANCSENACDVTLSNQ